MCAFRYVILSTFCKTNTSISLDIKACHHAYRKALSLDFDVWRCISMYQQLLLSYSTLFCSHLLPDQSRSRSSHVSVMNGCGGLDKSMPFASGSRQ